MNHCIRRPLCWACFFSLLSTERSCRDGTQKGSLVGLELITVSVFAGSIVCSFFWLGCFVPLFRLVSSCACVDEVANKLRVSFESCVGQRFEFLISCVELGIACHTFC